MTIDEKLAILAEAIIELAEKATYSETDSMGEHTYTGISLSIDSYRGLREILKETQK